MPAPGGLTTQMSSSTLTSRCWYQTESSGRSIMSIWSSFADQPPEQPLYLRSFTVYFQSFSNPVLFSVRYCHQGVFRIIHCCLQYEECVQLSCYASFSLVLLSTEAGLKLGTEVVRIISFVALAVRDVIEYLWYCRTIVLLQTLAALYMSGLIVGSLWLIYLVFHAGKLDSLFPDDSYIDMGEIDVGRKVTQQIPPGVFWRSQVFIDHPMYLKFNVSLSKDALVGIYGRRGLPPSHTQVRHTWMSLFDLNVIRFVFVLPFLPFFKRNNLQWSFGWAW